MDPDTVERKLAAILSADVAGYSRLMAQDEVATLRTLAAYMEEIRLLVRQHRGRAVGSAGDSLLAEFPSALDAVAGAPDEGSLAAPQRRRTGFEAPADATGGSAGKRRIIHPAAAGGGEGSPASPSERDLKWRRRLIHNAEAGRQLSAAVHDAEDIRDRSDAPIGLHISARGEDVDPNITTKL